MLEGCLYKEKTK